MMGSLRFRAPVLMALVAGLAELSGVLFAVGFLTPLAALGMTVVMLNAIGSVHWPKGFWNSNGGYELNLGILAVAVGIAATGPGRFSLDRLIGWDGSLSGAWWGVGVLGGAALISLLTLTLGRRRPARAQAAELRRAA